MVNDVLLRRADLPNTKLPGESVKVAELFVFCNVPILLPTTLLFKSPSNLYQTIKF